MIIIKIKGGLGNQMFQYAFGRSLALRRKTELLLDVSSSNVPGVQKDTAREYKLSAFNIQARIASEAEIAKVRTSWKLFYEKVMRKMFGFNYYAFDKKRFNAKDNSYFDGYWFQSEQYFKDFSDTLRKEFTLKNALGQDSQSVEEKIKQTNSISLHIRRGDYVQDAKTNRHHGALPLSYYENAVAFFQSKISDPTFFIFSDDISWVKENLKINSPVFFVSPPNPIDYEEIVLMSKCKHQIIANSTFSWWGAWLNQNSSKIVVAPKKWVNDPGINTDAVVPQSWVKM